MTATTTVKGVVLRGILRDAKENLSGGIPKLVESLPREIREREFSQKIAHGVLYPYEVFTSVLETYSKVAGGGRPGVIEDLGSRAAHRDLGSILKIYAAVSSTYRVGQHSATVWSQRFKNAGVMTMTDKENRSFRLDLQGFPDIHRHHCSFLAGYGRGIGLTWEKTFNVIHDQCVHRGASSCSWLGTW